MIDNEDEMPDDGVLHDVVNDYYFEKSDIQPTVDRAMLEECLNRGNLTWAEIDIVREFILAHHVEYTRCTYYKNVSCAEVMVQLNGKLQNWLDSVSD